MNIREELDREREAFTADPADCERCRFAPSGRCRFHADLDACDSCNHAAEQHGDKYGCSAGKTTRMPAGGCDIDVDHDCGCPEFKGPIPIHCLDADNA